MKYLQLFEEFKIKKFKKIWHSLDANEDDYADWYPGAGVGKVTGAIQRKSDNPLKKTFKKLMKRILDSFNLPDTEVRYLNAGQYGMAFLVGGDKIIKITSDQGEAKIAKSLINRNIPKCVEYYDVVKLKNGLFAILMQKADPLTQEEEDLISDLIDNFNDEDYAKNAAKRGLKHHYSKGSLEDIAENHGITIDNVKEYAKKLRAIYKSFKKHKISTQDLHTGNMGYVGDDLVHFDIMSNTSPSDLSKITKL